MGDVTDLSQLHGRGDRRPGVRQARGGARPGQERPRRSRSWPAARPTTARASSSGRPSCAAPTRPTRSSPPSTSARSWRSTSTTTAVRRDARARPRTSRRTALTGSIIATDRAAIAQAAAALRFAAGNFYINDKPTGAVVGQQPFGGARASGTNDKAGSVLNLPLDLPARDQGTFVPPTDYRYPHMG